MQCVDTKVTHAKVESPDVKLGKPKTVDLVRIWSKTVLDRFNDVDHVQHDNHCKQVQIKHHDSRREWITDPVIQLDLNKGHCHSVLRQPLRKTLKRSKEVNRRIWFCTKIKLEALSDIAPRALCLCFASILLSLFS